MFRVGEDIYPPVHNLPLEHVPHTLPFILNQTNPLMTILQENSYLFDNTETVGLDLMRLNCSSNVRDVAPQDYNELDSIWRCCTKKNYHEKFLRLSEKHISWWIFLAKAVAVYMQRKINMRNSSVFRKNTLVGGFFSKSCSMTSYHTPFRPYMQYLKIFWIDFAPVNKVSLEHSLLRPYIWTG